MLLFSNFFPKENKFYEEVRKTNDLNQLNKFLDTDAEYYASFVVQEIAHKGMSRSVGILEDLWDGGELFQSLKNKAVYEKPIARLMLARHLLSLKPKSEYADYIKQHAHDKDPIVQRNAAMALLGVRNTEAVKLLAELARSKNQEVSATALSTLFHYEAENEPNLGAFDEIRKLKSETTDPKLQELINKWFAQLEREQKAVSVIYEPPFTEKIEPYLEAKDFQTAINILIPYGEQNDVRAQKMIGDFYMLTKPPNYQESVKWITLAVNANYAPAKVSMANLYIGGFGVEKNTEKAVQLLHEAEAQGDQSAKNLLDMAKRNGWWGLGSP